MKIEIWVYGKPDCQKCNAFKEKLKLMKFEYSSVDANKLQEMWEEGGVARDAAITAQSALACTNGEFPTIVITGEGLYKTFIYSEAIAYLKKYRKDTKDGAT